jgi:dihydropyrimidinase
MRRRALLPPQVSTISRGRLVWHDGVLDVQPGSGRFVQMPAFGPAFDGIEARDRLSVRAAYGETPVRRDGAGSLSGRDEL